MINNSFYEIHRNLENKLRNWAKPVDTGHWQGEATQGKPDLITYELLNVSFTWSPVPEGQEELAQIVKPHLPWAENHFLERVSGHPHNPGQTYKHWPFYKHSPHNDRFRTEDGKFTHTYMERYWPPPTTGIRYFFGNIADVISLLVKYPFTRQAFLPVWFPEDTGALHGGRVPCTLGYHFIRRGDWFQVTYYIRSCDWIRHFNDDVYLTVRLLQWVLDSLKQLDPETWSQVKPSLLVFHCTSLHMFAADRYAMGWSQ